MISYTQELCPVAATPVDEPDQPDSTPAASNGKISFPV